MERLISIWPFRLAHKKAPAPFEQVCSLYANDRLIAITTERNVGRAQLPDFDAPLFMARHLVARQDFVAACASALDHSIDVLPAQRHMFPDFLETAKRYARWTEDVVKLDGRKSKYKVWDKMRFVRLIHSEAGYLLMPQKVERFQAYTPEIGPDRAPLCLRFESLEDAVAHFETAFLPL